MLNEVIYYDEDDVPWGLVYTWSPVIQAVVCGPVEMCHPEEGGVEPEYWTRDGKRWNDEIPPSIYDELVQRAYDGARQ